MLSTDSAALEYAFTRHHGEVYAFVLRRLRDAHDAEELTQQTFVDAAAAFSRGAAPRAMRPWLFSVAERRIADELRRRGRRSSVPEAAVEEVAPVESRLANALEQLSPEDRTLLFLRYVAERTHDPLGGEFERPQRRRSVSLDVVERPRGRRAKGDRQ